MKLFQCVQRVEVFHDKFDVRLAFPNVKYDINYFSVYAKNADKEEYCVLHGDANDFIINKDTRTITIIVNPFKISEVTIVFYIEI